MGNEPLYGAVSAAGISRRALWRLGLITMHSVRYISQPCFYVRDVGIERTWWNIFVNFVTTKPQNSWNTSNLVEYFRFL